MAEPGRDEDVAAALCAGDEAMFGWIVRSWSPTLLRTAIAIAGDRATAENLVEGTWRRMPAAVASFRPPPGLRAWMYGLLLRVAGLWLDGEAGHDRRMTHPDAPTVDPERFLPPSDPAWPGHWALPPAPWPAAEDRRPAPRGVGAALRAALGELPAAQRVVVGLRDVAGFEVAEISDLVGQPPERVRLLLNRGRAHLRSRLELHFAGSRGPG